MLDTVHIFYMDELFQNTTDYSIDEVGTPPIAYMGKNEKAYFQTITTLRYTRPTGTMFHDVDISDKRVSIAYDYDKHKDEIIDLTRVTTPEKDLIFRALNFVVFSDNATASDLDFALRNDTDLQNIYVPDSIKLSITKIEYTIPTPDVLLDIRDFFDLSFSIQTVNGVEILPMRVWVSRERFLEAYPFSTISKVIFPVPVEYLIDPSGLDGNVDSIMNSSDFTFQDISSELVMEDQTGIISYKTTYQLPNSSKQILPFGIVYHGAEPSTMEIRKAIKDALMKTGALPEYMWEELFPDLFVTAQYYFIPLWDNTIIRPDRVFYPSFLPMGDLLERVKLVFPDMETEFITKYARLITNAYSEIFMIVVPDILNENENFDIMHLHPTYQMHSSQEAAFAWMDPETKEFNIQLNRALAVLFGEANTSATSIVTIDGNQYASFISSKVDYNILAQDSYNAIFIDKPIGG